MLNPKSWQFKIIVVFLILTIYESIIRHNKDFDVFIGASKLIFDGKNCYEVWLKSGTSGLKYFYSPLFAVLLYPLKELPQLAYNMVWIALNFVIIYRSFILLTYFMPIKNLRTNKKQMFFILTVVCSARFMLDNLDLGQMTFLLVWASLESFKLIVEGKEIAGSALLALIINFKIIPLALLFYLFYTKKFKSFTLTILFLVLYLFLPALVIGFDFNNELLHNWFSSLTNTTNKSIYDDVGRPSLSSLIPSLVMDTPVQFSLKRNFITLNETSTKMILMLIRLLLLVLLAMLFGKPFEKTLSKKKLFYALSLICLATPLIFPHQGKYSFFYLMPAYAYVIYSLIKLFNCKKNPRYKRLYTLLLTFFLFSFAAVTLTTDGLIGRHLSDFCEYMHFITYGSLCLLCAMAFLKPKTSIHYLRIAK